MYGLMTANALAKKVVTYINIDSVVLYTSFGIVAVASVILYILAVSEWMPSLLIAKRRVSGALYDRGIEKYVFPEGRGVVYQPGLASRRYMKKYMLFSYEDKKYIRCMFDQNVRSAYSEIIIYDNQNKIIKTVDLFTPVGDTSYSEAILLPEQTSHVCVSVLKVNGKDVEGDPRESKWLKRHLWKRRGIFAAMAVAVTFVESTLLVSLLNYFLDLFLEKGFKTTFEAYVGSSNAPLNFLVTLLVGIFVAVVGIVAHMKNN